MLILNKKIYISFGLILGLGIFLGTSLVAQAAVSSRIKQVKIKNNPAVYFLDHASHRKKVYINATAYLNYGNKWSDVKTIAASELNSWSDIKLLKTKDSPGIYYISGSRRALILNMDDLRDFSLAAEPILTVSEADLLQYQLVSYEEIGLRRSAKLLVFNDLVSNENNNTFLTNTGGNLIGIFRFRSPARAATLSSLTLSLSGVYNTSILESAFISDEKGNPYASNVSINKNERRIYVSFPEPLAFTPGEEKTIEFFLSFKTCACDNQTLRAEFKRAEDIQASLPLAADFPLLGTTFKLISNSQILAKLTASEQSLVGSNLMINTGNRLIGQFVLSEDSGLDNALVKRITFENFGSAGKDDWEDFRLSLDNQVIARADTTDSRGKIVFNINYLSIEKGSPRELKVLAALKDGYRPSATFDLGINAFWALGQSQNFSLQPTINNLGESYTLN